MSTRSAFKIALEGSDHRWMNEQTLSWLGTGIGNPPQRRMPCLPRATRARCQTSCPATSRTRDPVAPTPRTRSRWKYPAPRAMIASRSAPGVRVKDLRVGRGTNKQSLAGTVAPRSNAAGVYHRQCGLVKAGNAPVLWRRCYGPGECRVACHDGTAVSRG